MSGAAASLACALGRGDEIRAKVGAMNEQYGLAILQMSRPSNTAFQSNCMDSNRGRRWRTGTARGAKSFFRGVSRRYLGGLGS